MPFKKPHHTSDRSCIIPLGGDKFEIQPRGLNIVWGNDSRYWKIPDQGPAELIQVSWLEVSGMVTVSNPKKYKVTFDVKVKDDGFGWNGTDVLVMAKIGKTGKYQYKVTNLTPGQNVTIPTEELLIEVTNSTLPVDLHFGLYEVWSGKWKGGLEIIKAEVSPV
ncbi:PHLOEM PROTEIN 2 A9 [Spatholobus suberectus]|nr:PHLOEM PROTEIN 2 A9 [Spatholobus suberectus]